MPYKRDSICAPEQAQYTHRSVHIQVSHNATSSLTAKNMATSQLFHTSFTDSSLPVLNFPGLYIPQSVWVPAAGPRDWERMHTIRFTQNGRQGINLGDAYRRNFNGMPDGQVIPCTSTTSQRVAIRINWPGYEPWHKHVNVANNSEHINKARLAYEVAKEVQRFYSEMGHNRGKERDWRVEVVPFEQLVLIELRHVGTGSWQPVLARAMS